MLVERTAPLVDHDAVAVRGGSDTLVFYAEQLTHAQRRVLQAHLLAVLSDEPSVTIAVPAGWAAAEVAARRRRHEPLTAGAILFGVAAAAALTVFVAAVIILVANEHREGLTVAQGPGPSPAAEGQDPIPSRGGGTQPALLAPAVGHDAPGSEQPPGASDPPSRIALAPQLPDDLAPAGAAQPAPPVLEAATPEHAQLPHPPALEPADLPAPAEVRRLPVDLPEPSVSGGPGPGSSDVEVPNDRDVETEVPDVEVSDRNSGPSRPADRGEDDVPEQDGAEDADDGDHDSEPASEGASRGSERADGQGGLGVDLTH